MQQITKTSDKLTSKVIVNRISDVPGGVSLNLSTLVAGSVVMEGTPLTAPTDGKRTVCKQAKALADTTVDAVKVTEKEHNFKVGDIIGTKLSGKAYAIDSIDNANGIDTLNVGTSIDLAAEGDFIYEMNEETADSSALKNTADVILKEAFEVPSATQVIWIKDAFVRADVKEKYIGSLYLATLDVNEIKY